MPNASIDHGVLPNLVGFNLRRAYFIATQIFAEQFSEHEFTAIQFAIMEIIAANGFLTQREIAHEIGTAPSVIVKPIRNLEAQGFVERTRDENDRRNFHFRLTEQGGLFQASARRQILEVEEKLLGNLSADDRATLITLLHKIIDKETP